MTLRLHDYLPSGNGYKVRLLMSHLGITFERIEYNITKGETRTPEFLQNVNANGRVPVLETETGEFLPESNAILFYLAEGTPFLPDDRSGKAHALRWMFFEQYSHEPNIAVARAWLHVFDAEMTEERRTALETEEGEFLPESNAILFYLSGGTPLLPDDRLGRARAAVDVLRAVQPRAEHSRGTRLASRLRHGDDGKTPDRPRGETKARVRRARGHGEAPGGQ